MLYQQSFLWCLHRANNPIWHLTSYLSHILAIPSSPASYYYLYYCSTDGMNVDGVLFVVTSKVLDPSECRPLPCSWHIEEARPAGWMATVAVNPARMGRQPVVFHICCLLFYNRLYTSNLCSLILCLLYLLNKSSIALATCHSFIPTSPRLFASSVAYDRRIGFVLALDRRVGLQRLPFDLQPLCGRNITIPVRSSCLSRLKLEN